jgi:hypothetical protein
VNKYQIVTLFVAKSVSALNGTCAALTGADIIIIIIMDAHLTILELCAPFSRMLHSHYIIAVHLSQLAVNFMGQGWGDMSLPQKNHIRV